MGSISKESAMSEVKEKIDYAALYAEADKAGRAAAESIKPAPMVVSEADVFGKRLPEGKSWYVSEGVCGFAWVSVRPGSCGMAKWLKEKKGARIDSYAGGMRLSISAYGQSMERKAAYADAFAAVLCKAGIRAYGDSRMD
jgi:hypothetical protein